MMVGALQDLAQYQPRWLDPVSTTYRGRYTVCAAPPPNHGTQILECLNLLEGYPLAEWGHNSEKALHVFFESMKRAAADRAVWRRPETAAGLPTRDSEFNVLHDQFHSRTHRGSRQRRLASCSA